MMSLNQLEQLLAEGCLTEAARLLDSLSSLPRSFEVTRLRLESQTGDPVLAKQGAEQLLAAHLTAAEKVACLDICGRVAAKHGEVAVGLRALRQAQQLASTKCDAKVQARQHASLTDVVLHWVGVEPALSELAVLRRLSLQAGDPATTLEFHILGAEIAAKRHDTQRLASHLRTAEGLVDRYPNHVHKARLRLVQANSAAISSSPVEAIRLGEQALAAAQRAGSISAQIPCLVNLAHWCLVVGRFDECASYLSRVTPHLRRGGAAELGMRDTELQLALARGDTERAEALLEMLAGLSARLDDGHSYYGLWHTLTRVRWLFRSARAAEGLSLALDAIPRIVAMADRQLLERMRLLAAEGLALTGRTAEAAALMAQAVLDNPDPPLGMVAEASRVAGRLAAADHPPAALAHFERAARILACLGNAAARAQVQATAGEVLALAGPAAPQVSGGDEEAGAAGTWAGARDAGLLAPPLAGRLDAVGPQAAEPHAAAARAVERVGAAIDLGMHPALVGHELLAVIAETRAAAAAALIEARPDGTRGVLASTGCDAEGARRLAADATAVHVPLGTGHGRTCEVVAASPSAASARVSLLAVERVAAATRELVDARERERQRAALWPEQTIEQQLGMIFASEVMSELVKTTRRVATTNVTVLITGETGTGKELLARALHQASSRREHPFVPFNCTAVAREMIDAQLFGYRRGAFTGAQDAFPGVIRAAAGGTLFLDEIGEVGMEVQPKLLRFLESGEVHPLGETRPEAVNVRVVAATNADLDRLVSEGRFREDLFYRLDVVRLHIPPLRERREEIPVLVDHFLSKYAEEAKKGGLRLAEETMEYLVLYRWPGNVRQLANELHRLVALAESGAVLMPEHLSREIATSRKTVPASERDLVPTELVVRIDQPMSAATEHLERAMILHAMRRTAGRVEDAARVLGLSRKGLYLKRQRFGLA